MGEATPGPLKELDNAVILNEINKLMPYAEKYGVTTFAYKRIGTKVTSVFKSESVKARLSTPEVGQQMSLYDNIVGLSFLTFLPM